MQRRRELPRERRNPAESAADREFLITRVFEAPARLLFEAHSKPEHVQRWFGPKGFSLPLCEIDFRVGGRFRFGMRAPDGTDLRPFGGEYLEIVPNERIVYTSGWDDDEAMIITVTFVQTGGLTTLAIHTLFASVAQKNEHLGRGYASGVGQGLDRLEEFVR
jgi:uncharacterized protein YndB with AHSA1/START domain